MLRLRRRSLTPWATETLRLKYWNVKLSQITFNDKEFIKYVLYRELKELVFIKCQILQLNSVEFHRVLENRNITSSNEQMDGSLAQLLQWRQRYCGRKRTSYAL